MTTTVDQILTPAELDAFRAGYSNEWMSNTAYGWVAGSFLQAGPAVQLVIDTYTRRWPDAPEVGPATLPPAAAPVVPVPIAMSARERERVIIALMTSTAVSPMLLAIHLYWGLMEGLSPADIGWTQLLTGAYEGIDKYSNGVAVLSTTLTAMKSVLPRTDTPTVFAALAAAIRPVTQAQLAAFAKLNHLELPE